MVNEPLFCTKAFELNYIIFLPGLGSGSIRLSVVATNNILILINTIYLALFFLKGEGVWTQMFDDFYYEFHVCT